MATPWVSHPNNVRDYFRMGISTNSGISVARGDDKYQFRVGYNYEKQVSNVPDAGTNKTNISLNTDYHLADGIRHADHLSDDDVPDSVYYKKHSKKDCRNSLNSSCEYSPPSMSSYPLDVRTTRTEA